MAKIPQYENPIEGLRPDERGIDSLTQAARRTGALFSSAAEAVKSTGDQLAHGVSTAFQAVGNVAVDYITHKEIADGSAAFSGMNDKLTQNWNERVKGADPRDPTVAANFKEGVLEPELQRFKDQFKTEKGQAWAEHHVESLRNHMFEKTTADMGSLAADALAVNMKQTANNLSNTAVQDPSAVPFLLGSVDSTVGPLVDSSPYLKGAVGAKAKAQLTESTKEKIVQGGMMSAIQKSGDPEGEAAKWIAKYPQYINGQEALMAGKAAKTQIRFDQAQARQERVAQKQLDTMEADKAGAALVVSVIKPDGTVDITQKPKMLQSLHEMVMPGPKQLPGMTTGKALELFKFANSEDVVRADDPETKTTLQAGIVSGKLDPLDIIRAANDNKITHATAGILEGQRKLIEEHPVNSKGLQVVFDGAKAALVLPTAHSDFMQEFLPQYLKAKADGSLKMGDLNFSDPNSMVSKAVAAHMPSQADKVQYQVLKNLGMGIGNSEEQLKIINAPQVPAGMTTKDAIAKYGAGAVVKNSRGEIVTLPKQ